MQYYLEILLLTARQTQIILSEGKQWKIDHQELPVPPVDPYACVTYLMWCKNFSVSLHFLNPYAQKFT